jgi:2-polyprenyl-3-methyl-5-hydroxy-6-metoxy-1,4-benzoquinol methylase
MARYPHLDMITHALLDAWPEHDRFIQASFRNLAPESMRLIDETAGLALSLIGEGLKDWALDYRWMCEMLMEERLYFVRNKRYRRSTFAEAQEIYGDAVFMSRYLNGLLLSQICWSNHARAIERFRTGFLPGNPTGYDHLEVGPGHGLLLALAIQDPRCRSASGWDSSPSSVDIARKAFVRAGIAGKIRLETRDIVQGEAGPEQFDSIVCSEVLEHTENPGRALENLYRSLRPGGSIFLNVPLNSPAPDHIYLWRRAAEVAELIAAHGFVIAEFLELPPTGKTLEQAKTQGLDISCVAIARRE